jgi:hypothetical protein
LRHFLRHSICLPQTLQVFPERLFIDSTLHITEQANGSFKEAAGCGLIA